MKTIKYSDKEAVDEVIHRSEQEYDDVIEAAKKILLDVKQRGDAALFDYTWKFDKQKINADSIRVPEKEIKEAQNRCDKKLVSALKQAYKNIKKFHDTQYQHLTKKWKTKTEKGITITEKTTPLNSIAAYIPGGRAAYPSTVLMTCIPAKVAGVKKVVVLSPPPIPDAVLAACSICKVDEVYRVGGVQAIAAAAYGTKSIKKVDKIVGPGNKYVQAAKTLVYGETGIDMPAGPSEVLIIADKKTNPAFIAADLLAQAEHDPDSKTILVTDSEKKIMEVEEEIKKQIKTVSRREVINKSLSNSTAILVKDMNEAVLFTNEYAPEHTQIMTEDARKIAEKIKNSGTIYVGEYAPTPAGDYASGGNHVLPTNKTARFSSELSVRDFIRHYTIQEIKKEGLKKIAEAASLIADAEGLDAHRESIKKRFQQNHYK